jgi:hypothetical protein
MKAKSCACPGWGYERRRRRRRGDGAGGIGTGRAGFAVGAEDAAGLGAAEGSGWRGADASRAAASVRCSSCGRDTSRARMAVDSVILVIGMYASVA